MSRSTSGLGIQGTGTQCGAERALNAILQTGRTRGMVVTEVFQRSVVGEGYRSGDGLGSAPVPIH